MSDNEKENLFEEDSVKIEQPLSKAKQHSETDDLLSFFKQVIGEGGEVTVEDADTLGLKEVLCTPSPTDSLSKVNPHFDLSLFHDEGFLDCEKDPKDLN